MNNKTYKASIEKIEHFSERYTLVSGYQNGQFVVAAYEGQNQIKSLSSDDMNAVSTYESLKQWLSDKASHEK